MAPTAAKKFVESGARFLTSLTGLYSKTAKATPPPITERTAVLCSVLFTVLYIAPFYLSPTLRATPLSSRDAPSVIQARVRAVILTCFACTAITAYVLIDVARATTTEVLRLTGIWPTDALDCINVLALVMVLFVGPLYETLLVDGEWRDISFRSIKGRFWDSWIGYRNLIVAPVSEELVFRSLTIPLYLVARVDSTRIVFISPLIFGLAHVHHLVEFVSAHKLPGQKIPPGTIWLKGIVRSLFQFTYTSLFGFFATFVFLRTGSIWTVILAHAFCNSMGFPRVWGRVGGNETSAQHITPDVAQGKRNDDDEMAMKVGNGVLLPESVPDKHVTSRPRMNNLSTMLYYALLFAGAYGFYRLLWRLTESNYALASFAASSVKH